MTSLTWLLGICGVYFIILFYSAMARVWSIMFPNDIPPLPPKPPSLVLPDHPHGKWGHDDEVHGVACKAVNPIYIPDEKTVYHSVNYCSDCKHVIHDFNKRTTEWAHTHNTIVKAMHASRNPWLWPVWLFLKPIELLAPPTPK